MFGKQAMLCWFSFFISQRVKVNEIWSHTCKHLIKRTLFGDILGRSISSQLFQIYPDKFNQCCFLCLLVHIKYVPYIYALHLFFKSFPKCPKLGCNCQFQTGNPRAVSFYSWFTFLQTWRGNVTLPGASGLCLRTRGAVRCRGASRPGWEHRDTGNGYCCGGLPGL